MRYVDSCDSRVFRRIGDGSKRIARALPSADPWPDGPSRMASSVGKEVMTLVSRNDDGEDKSEITQIAGGPIFRRLDGISPMLELIIDPATMRN